MALDDIIEKLAFGESAPKATHCLGLFLSPETIYIAETRVERGRIAVDHLVRIPLPQPDAAKTAGGLSTATLNTDFLTDSAKLAGVIKPSMAQIKWGTRDVVVTLSHHLGLLRYFAMPAIDRRFWKSAVPLEAKKYIPIPFDQLSHDFQVAPLPADPAGKARQAALIAVTQKKNLANVTALLEALNLNLIAMEVAPCSVLRVWESLEKDSAGQACGQVHFDGGNIRILLSDRGLPVFFRELFLGQQASVNDLRKIDLSGCMAFAQKNLAVGALSRLRVSGAGTALAPWAEAFSQETGVKAGTQDTASMLGIKAADWGGYAAIGASTRFLAPSAAPLDLGRVGRVSDEEKLVARDVAWVSGGIAGLLLAFGLFQQAVCSYKAGQLSHYKRDPMIEGIFTGKSSNQIEDMLRTMKQQADFGQAFAGSAGPDAPRMILLLKDIVDSLPEKVWLTRINVNLSPLQTSFSSGQFMELGGNASGQTVPEEQAMPYQFRERLLARRMLAKVFPDLQVTLSGSQEAAAAEQARGGASPAEVAKKLEGRTTFTLSGRSKK